MKTIRDISIVRVNGAATAAQTAVQTSSIETKRPISVVFLVTLATIASGGVVLLTAQGRSTYGTGSWNDLSATLAHTATGAETGVVMALEVSDPAQWSELRVEVARSTANSAIENVTAMVIDSGNRPVTQAAGVYIQSVLNPSAA
jgi:hypothetical protein